MADEDYYEDSTDAPPVDSDARRAILAGMMSGNTAAPVPASHEIAAPDGSGMMPGGSNLPVAPPVETGGPSVPASAPSFGAPPVQPSRQQAQINTIGNQPNQKDYQPIITHPLLRRIGVGLAAFGMGPQAGAEAYHNAFVAPVEHAQKSYENDTQAYNERLKGMNEQETQEREGNLQDAQARLANAEATAKLSPPPKEGLTPEETTIHDLMTGDNGHPRVNPQTGNPYDYLSAFTAVAQAKQDTKPDKTPSENEQAIGDYLKGKNLADTPANRDKARDVLKTRDRTPRQPTDREEWQQDHPGEPIENYWTAKAGAGANAKAEAGEEAGKAAQQYADDYMKSKKFTGAGDEALMEKYFELAKPSSGFRMTQPQIEMLRQSQDLMNSIVAKGKHLFTPEAPYFSETQREQIVDTMKNLESSRQEVKKPAATKKTSAPSPTGGGRVIKYDAQGNRISG